MNLMLFSGIIEKVCEKAIRKNLGKEADLNLNALDFKVKKGRVKAHLELDAEMSEEDFKKLICETIKGEKR